MGDLEQIYRPDIITDADDADNEINAHDPVVALHPSFPYSYAPGTQCKQICLYFLPYIRLARELGSVYIVRRLYWVLEALAT